MPRLPKANHGYDRSRQVPVIDGAEARVCKRCDLWFAARPREQICDGCVPVSERTKRLAHCAIPDHPLKAHSRAGQRHNKTHLLARESALLGVTFAKPVPICRALALEAAACIDGKRPKDAWPSSPLAPRSLRLHQDHG
jgi:hypothetical protein